MAIYTIPPEVIAGFEQISKLDDKELNFFKGVLESIAAGNTSNDFIETSSKEANISPKEVEDVMGSIVSMTDIYWRSKDTPNKFSEDFTHSFLAHNENAKNLDLEKFKKNIAFLVTAMGADMRSSLKAKELLNANQNNYAGARIVSDIRIVYDDDDKLDKKEQLAVVVHNLRIRYNSMPRGQVFIALDLSDLHHLQKIITRAIEKDKLMRTNAHQLTFVDPK